MRIYNCEMDTGCLKKFPCLAKAARHGASLVKLEKRLPKIECGPRASHPRTASFVCSCPGTVYRGGGDMNATASIFPRGALHVLKLGCRLVIVRSQILNRCGANSSALLSRARRGRRPQRPGNQSALARDSGSSPRRFALENHRCCSLAAIIWSSQKPSRFAETQFLPVCRWPQHKKGSTL